MWWHIYYVYKKNRERNRKQKQTKQRMFLSLWENEKRLKIAI